MELKLKVYDALCSTSVFEINEIEADYNDFGDKYDTDPESAEDYACGNMEFIPDGRPKSGILDKYSITEEEFKEIQRKLDALSFGDCGWCV